MPYIAASLFNTYSSKNIYKFRIKKLEKKIKRSPKDSQKIKTYLNDIANYKKILEEPKNKFHDYKVIRQENYNFQKLIVVLAIILLTGLLTPIHKTPYTYIIKSMFGQSNFDTNISSDYVLEMQPIIPISNLGFMTFTIILLTFLTFLPTRLKTEHGFLLLGLYLMTLSSSRYVYLLVLLGSYVLNDLITQATNLLIRDDIDELESLFSFKLTSIVFILLTTIFSTSMFLENLSTNYVDTKAYPVAAVEYIKENLDYKNIKIYNSYNNGSYLMLNDIPVFIDSRLDVYCSEFNDTNIFYDFIQVSNGYKHYDEIFEKYNFTHILLQSNDIAQQYICKDQNYKEIYADNYYVLYEKLN